MPLASSTVMTPSLPTRAIASAMMPPMVSSWLAEMVPTWAIMSPLTGFEWACECGDDGGDRLVDAALEVPWAGAGRDVADAFAADRLGEQGGGGRAVSGEVGGLAGDFLDHLRAEALERIRQLNLARHRDAVLGDGGRAVRPAQDDIAPLRAEGDSDGVGESVDAAKKSVARVLAVGDVSGHGPASVGDCCQPWLLRCEQPWLADLSVRAASQEVVPPVQDLIGRQPEARQARRQTSHEQRRPATQGTAPP